MGTTLRADHLRHRRRHPEEPAVQGRADGRAVRRLRPGAIPRPADRLRLGQEDRRDHGLRRPDRHGREHLHGGHRPVLPGLHAERIVRQVRAVPRRHAPHARHPQPHLRRARAGKATSTTSNGWRGTSRQSSLCGLGQTAPNPVLTTLRYFREEYEEHIRLKHCRASVVRGAGRRALRARLPGRRQRAAVPGADRRRAGWTTRSTSSGGATRSSRSAAASATIPANSRCRRADVDEPLAIRALKRYAADHAQKYDAAAAAAGHGQGGGRHRRRRARRAELRLFPGADGTAVRGLREAADPRRHAGPGHPRIPAAEDDPAEGHRLHPAARRRAAHRHAGARRRRPAQGRASRPIFLATGAQKGRAAAHRGRGPRRRAGQPGVPPRPRARPNAALRQARGRDRRRQRGRGRGALGAAARRGEGHDPVPPHPRGDARLRGRDRGGAERRRRNCTSSSRRSRSSARAARSPASR